MFALAVSGLLFACPHQSKGQSTIYSNTIDGTVPSSSTAYYTTGQVVAANVVGTGLELGTGVTSASTSNRYVGSNFATAAQDSTKFIKLVLGPASGYTLSLATFAGDYQASGTGPTNFALDYQIGSGTITQITTGTNTRSGSAVGFSFSLASTAALQADTSTITLYLYEYGGAAAGTFSINDFTVSGSTAATGGGGTTPTTQYFGTTGQGYNANSTVFDTTTADFNPKNDGTGTPTTYNSTLLAIFAGTSGNVAVASGGVTVGAGLEFDSTGYTLSGGALTLASAGNTVQVTNGTDTTTISSPLAGSGGLTKTGAGKLVLTGMNGNTGAFSTSAGTLEVNNGNNAVSSFGVSGTGTAIIDAGSTVTLTNGSLPVTTGGTLTINGTVLNNSTTSLSSESGTVTVASGGTVIQQGTGSPSAFLFTGTTPATFQPGSTFIFRDYTATPSVSGRTYTGNLTFDSSGAAVATSAVSGSGVFTVNGDLTVGANTTLNYTTGIKLTQAFNGNVTVNGNLGGTNGTQSFAIASGKSLFVGTGGVVNFAAANATSGLPNQSLTISQGGTLMGVGTISGPGTTLVSGALSPGSAVTTATITLGALTLDGNSTLNFNINSATTKDLVDLNGGVTAATNALTLGSGALALALPSSGFDYTATYAVFTDVSGVTGSFGTVTGYDNTDYAATFTLKGSEYDLSFTVVPEPTTVLGGLLLAGAVGFHQRRRLGGLTGWMRSRKAA